MMASTRRVALTPPVDAGRDHVLGPADAEITLVEYGSYACPTCHAVHAVVEDLRSRFGERMRYVFRHQPVPGSEEAVRAAELAEYAAEEAGRFWEVHEALMERGPVFAEGDIGQIARDFGLPECDAASGPALTAARARVREHIESGRRSGVLVTPTFFINGRRYAGTWDESSLADAMLGSLGHRIQAAAFEFVRWGPSSGLLLGLATVLALALSNSPLGPAFQAWWETVLGIRWGTASFALTLLGWVNYGLLTIFFLVVGLEIKREFTVGHLASFRSGSLPVIALFYTGEIVPGYLLLGAAMTVLLVGLNRAGVYRTLPYAVCGGVLWFFLHQAGLHATLAGVILAVLIPTLPPANLNVLLAQATTVIRLEDRHADEAMHPGPSEPGLRALDAIHARIASPAEKLLRSAEPWSSYVVLPIFALANAGVAWSLEVFRGQGRLMGAIVLGLVVGKPVGIVAAAWLAVRSRIAIKPEAYSWRQVVGAGAMGGIGFTMSLFIAGQAFPIATDYAAAKVAIFLASLLAASLGTAILYPRRREDDEPAPDDDGAAGGPAPVP